MFAKSSIDIIIKLSHQYTCFPLKNINFKCVIVVSDTMHATTEWPYIKVYIHVKTEFLACPWVDFNAV